jgi:hypothetical protein
VSWELPAPAGFSVPRLEVRVFQPTRRGTSDEPSAARHRCLAACFKHRDAEDPARPHQHGQLAQAAGRDTSTRGMSCQTHASARTTGERSSAVCISSSTSPSRLTSPRQPFAITSGSTSSSSGRHSSLAHRPLSAHRAGRRVAREARQRTNETPSGSQRPRSGTRDDGAVPPADPPARVSAWTVAAALAGPMTGAARLHGRSA